jgi:hypothetical protein
VIFKPVAPKPTRCHECGHEAAVSVCALCGTERPAYTALKNITSKQPAKPTDVARRYCMEPI